MLVESFGLLVESSELLVVAVEPLDVAALGCMQPAVHTHVVHRPLAFVVGRMQLVVVAAHTTHCGVVVAADRRLAAAAVVEAWQLELCPH